MLNPDQEINKTNKQLTQLKIQTRYY